MNLYDSLARRPSLTNALTVGVIAVSLAFIAHDVSASKAAGETGQTYFTVDDGRSYFADDPSHLPPYTINGQTAVRAYVYACDTGSPFVAYLERYTPEGLAELVKTDPGGKVPIDREFTLAETTEVKRPGDLTWVRRSSAEGERILDVTPPAGVVGTPRLMLPGD